MSFCFSPGGRAAVKLSSFYSIAARREESWLEVESDGARFFLAQLLLPVEDSRSISGGFGFGDQSFSMQRDRQSGKRERVIGLELHEPLARSYRLVKAVQLLQGARESVQGFRVRGINREALFIFRNGFFILALCKQVEASLEMRLCTFAVRSHLLSLSMATVRHGRIDSLNESSRAHNVGDDLGHRIHIVLSQTGMHEESQACFRKLA